MNGSSSELISDLGSLLCISNPYTFPFLLTQNAFVFQELLGSSISGKARWSMATGGCGGQVRILSLRCNSDLHFLLLQLTC